MKIETEEQLNKLYAFYRQEKENIFAQVNISPLDDKIYAMLLHVLNGDHGWYGEVIEEDGSIVGIFIGMLVAEVLSGKLLGQEVVAYLKPDKRSQPNKLVIGKAFLQFEEWSKQRGAYRVKVSTYGEYIPMLEQRGYVGYTTNMYKELK